jgi:PKD repeat protein
MHRKNQLLKAIRQNLLFAFLSFTAGNAGVLNAQQPADSNIAEPYSVDSLFITPAMPQEGDAITLNAFTTHSSSPCGLQDYQVVHSTTNAIYVITRYWQGMLTAMCQSFDSMSIGSLQAGHYVLNFSNLKSLEFTVYPRVECRADFRYVYPKCGTFDKCPNAVEFFDKSVGMIQSWHWDFGDGTYSTEQNPMHHFPDTGIFPVTLTVTGGITRECKDQVTKSIPVPLSLCKAHFGYEVLESPLMDIQNSPGQSPFPTFLVKFHDLSFGNVKEWSWDLGEGTLSDEQNPVHIYREGIYSVTLKIVTESGCVSSYTKRLVLIEPQACIHTGTVRHYLGLDGCNFIIELDSGPKLEPVSFVYPFDLYDGQRVIVGYEPLLDVASICMVGIPAEITCIREIPVPVCKAYFTWSPDSLANCISYNFQDQSRGKAINWHWDFGDGTTSDEQNPHHAYSYQSDSNQYNVCLTINTANGCTDTYCETVYPGMPAPTVPWKPVSGGEDNHTIVVSDKLGNSASLENGDYIGLFFRNYRGSLQCGGMIRWEGKTCILTAWENTGIYDSVWTSNNNTVYPVLCHKNGFDEGEKFEYKIWKWRFNKVIDIRNAIYTVNNVFPDSGFYNDDGMSLLTGFSSYQAQTIALHNGWNMVSLYVDPADPHMRSMFGNLPVIVKNYKGEIVYFPPAGITDGIWNLYEGYKVKSLENTSIRIPGTIVDPQLIIQLPGSKRPYFLPYYYTQPYPIQSMMRNIVNNIRYVQTYEYINGAIRALNYIPRYGIDQIHNMKPGFAYKLSFITPMRSFTYPPADQDSNWVCCYETKSTEDEISEESEMEPETNRILVIPEEIMSIPAGARITLFTGNNMLVGNETALGGNLAVTLWDLSGEEYDAVRMDVEDENGLESYTIDFTQNTVIEDGLVVLQKSMISGIDPVDAGLVYRLYPTPADNEVYLDLVFEYSSDVSLMVFDMLGNCVKQVDFNNISAGMNRLTFSVGNLTNGQYLYRINTNDQLARGKFQVQH